MTPYQKYEIYKRSIRTNKTHIWINPNVCFFQIKQRDDLKKRENSICVVRLELNVNTFVIYILICLLSYDDSYEPMLILMIHTMTFNLVKCLQVGFIFLESHLFLQNDF